ncbi:hypothetical protein ES703_109081 [subsurface metagenome]
MANIQRTRLARYELHLPATHGRDVDRVHELGAGRGDGWTERASTDTWSLRHARWSQGVHVRRSKYRPIPECRRVGNRHESHGELLDRLSTNRSLGSWNPRRTGESGLPLTIPRTGWGPLREYNIRKHGHARKLP